MRAQLGLKSLRPNAMEVRGLLHTAPTNTSKGQIQIEAGESHDLMHGNPWPAQDLRPESSVLSTTMKRWGLMDRAFCVGSGDPTLQRISKKKRQRGSLLQHSKNNKIIVSALFQNHVLSQKGEKIQRGIL